jgi:membrane protein
VAAAEIGQGNRIDDRSLRCAQRALEDRFGPAGGGANWPVLSPGSVFAILIWFGASQGLAVYLTNFASYNQVYASIGAVVALLMWFYITGYLVLLGAALDVALDRSGGGQETD